MGVTALVRTADMGRDPAGSAVDAAEAGAAATATGLGTIGAGLSTMGATPTCAISLRRLTTRTTRPAKSTMPAPAAMKPTAMRAIVAVLAPAPETLPGGDELGLRGEEVCEGSAPERLCPAEARNHGQGCQSIPHHISTKHKASHLCPKFPEAPGDVGGEPGAAEGVLGVPDEGGGQVEEDPAPGRVLPEPEGAGAVLPEGAFAPVPVPVDVPDPVEPLPVPAVPAVGAGVELVTTPPMHTEP